MGKYLDDLVNNAAYQKAAPERQQAMLDYAQHLDDTGITAEEVFPTGGGAGPGMLAPIQDILTGFTGYPNPTQMGITAGAGVADAARLMGRLPGRLGTAATLALPIVGGAAGGALEGGQEGALKGGVVGAALGTAGNVVNYLVNKPLGRIAEQSGLAALLSKYFPSLKARQGLITPKLDRLHELTKMGRGVEHVGKALRQVKGDISLTMRQPTAGGYTPDLFPVPALDESGIATKVKLPAVLGQPQWGSGGNQTLYTFEQADELISRMNKRAYNVASGDPVATASASEMREWSHDAVEQLTGELAKVNPQMAVAYTKAREEMANMKTIQEILSTPGAISRNRLNLDVIQKAIGDDPALLRSLGGTLDKPNAMGQDFLKWAFRGAPPTASDVTGGLTGGMSAGLGAPHVFLHPRLPRQVGQRPELPLRTTTIAGIRHVLSPEKAEAQQELHDAVRSGQTQPLGVLRKLATDPKAGLTSVQRRRLLGILPPAPLPAAPAVR